MTNAVSLNTATMTSARMFGPALGGVVVVSLGYGWCFMLDGVSYLAVLCGFLRMRRSELRPSMPTPAERGQVRAGLRYIAETPELRITLIVMATVGAFAFNLAVTIPLFVRSLGGSELSFTLMYSVLSVGSVSGALVAARRRMIQPRDVIVRCIGFGVAMTLMAATPNMNLLFPVAVVVGYTSVAFMTMATSVVQLMSRPEYRVA